MAIFKEKPLLVEFDDDPIVHPPRVLCLAHPMAGYLEARMAQKSLELGISIGGGQIAGSYSISGGGPGFLDAFLSLRHFHRHRVVTTNPAGRIVMAEFLYDHDSHEAVIESEQVLGPASLAEDTRNVMMSGSAGLADVIVAALSLGMERLYIGLGESGAWDAGCGMLLRLRDLLVDRRQDRTHYATQELTAAEKIGLRSLREQLHKVEVYVCASTDRPLLGKAGAARSALAEGRVTLQEAQFLEGAWRHWLRVLESEAGEPLGQLPGAGAAGGIGTALAAAGAQLISGPRLFFQLMDLPHRLQHSDGIVTCEAHLGDFPLDQSVPWKACVEARKAGRGALLVCAESSAEAAAEAASYGIVVQRFGRGMPQQRRTVEAFALLQQTVSSLVHMVG